MICQKDKFQLDECFYYLNLHTRHHFLNREKALLDTLLKERNPFLYQPKDF